MLAFDHLAIQQPMIDNAAVERLLKDLHQLLFVHLQPKCVESLHNFLFFHALCFPLECLFQEFTVFIDDDFPNSVDLHNVIALWHTGHPFSFLKLLLHPCDCSLFAELVVELREQQLNVLVQHPAWVGSISWLRNSKDGHPVRLPQVLSQFDGSTARTGEALLCLWLKELI
ncbi:MAG TPA: hypothetical protein VGB56_04460 [Flavisolibacter sp.]